MSTSIFIKQDKTSALNQVTIWTEKDVSVSNVNTTRPGQKAAELLQAQGFNTWRIANDLYNNPNILIHYGNAEELNGLTLDVIGWSTYKF